MMQEFLEGSKMEFVQIEEHHRIKIAEMAIGHFHAEQYFFYRIAGIDTTRMNLHLHAADFAVDQSVHQLILIDKMLIKCFF